MTWNHRNHWSLPGGWKLQNFDPEKIQVSFEEAVRGGCKPLPWVEAAARMHPVRTAAPGHHRAASPS